MNKCDNCQHYVPIDKQIGLCYRHRVSVKDKDQDMVYRGAMVHNTDVCMYHDEIEEKKDDGSREETDGKDDSGRTDNEEPLPCA
jgi:hypothetical protein